MTREVRHGRRSALLAMTASLILYGTPAASAGGPSPGVQTAERGVPRCTTLRPVSDDVRRRTDVSLSYRWQGRLDTSGTLRGHELRLPGGRRWTAGPRAFAESPRGDTLVTGERDARGTDVRILDIRRGCVMRTLRFGSLVYGTARSTDGSLYVSLVRRSDRREMGIWEVPAAGGAARRVLAAPSGRATRAVPRSLRLEALRDGVRATWCGAGTCVTRATTGQSTTHLPASVDVDLDLEPGASAPDSTPTATRKPVPIHQRWSTWTVLDFKFHATDSSPGWMRTAILAAAEDATDSSNAMSPIFTPASGGASGVIRYTATMPEACSAAIACASHSGSSWTLRMRPQNHDFRWGRLRWCEKTDANGCFDAERVALHEFGHIIGLDHPETAGLQLPASATVMHRVTPSKPNAGWGRHKFGACDVASLQRMFGLPTMSTRLSTCDTVPTRVVLSAPATTMSRGQKVTLTAVLRTQSGSALGARANMRLNERSVQLRRRPVGSTGSWVTSWMKSTGTPGTYSLSLIPAQSYEYRAVFPTPDDEGLAGSTSSDLVIRVTGPSTCTGNCPHEEEDPT